MRLVHRCIVAAAAVSVPLGPVPAQTDDTGGADNAIVVTGKSEAEARRETYNQARALSRMDGRTSRLYQQALPRFAAPVCPGVVGRSNGMSPNSWSTASGQTPGG